MEALRTNLNRIFFGDDDTKLKYIVPIGYDRVVPSHPCQSNIDASATWIGYIILNTKRNIRTTTGMQDASISVKQEIRISFMGPQAEEFANSTLIWDDQISTIKAFELMGSQLDYDKRRLYTHIVEEHGFNNEICWVVDLTAHSFYMQTFDNGPWITTKS